MLEDGLIRSTAYDLMNIIQVLSSSRMFTSKKVPILVTACSGVIATNRKPELAMEITSSLINTEVVFTEPPQIMSFVTPVPVPDNFTIETYMHMHCRSGSSWNLKLKLQTRTVRY